VLRKESLGWEVMDAKVEEQSLLVTMVSENRRNLPVSRQAKSEDELTGGWETSGSSSWCSVIPSDVLEEEAPVGSYSVKLPEFLFFFLDVENTENPVMNKFTLKEARKERLPQRPAFKMNVAEILRRYHSPKVKWKPKDLVLVWNHRCKKADPRWIGSAVVIEARDTGLSLKLVDGSIRIF